MIRDILGQNNTVSSIPATPKRKYRKRVPNKCKRWSDLEHQKLVHLVRSGKRYKQIAKELGRTEKAVTQRIWENKIRQ
jgi:DNA-binding NarL/FixJ family response regulator